MSIVEVTGVGDHQVAPFSGNITAAGGVREARNSAMTSVGEEFSFSGNTEPPRRRRALRTKRLIDICLSIAGLIFFAPVIVLVALALFIRDGNPIIFRQKRIGRNGKVFSCFKFRSMSRDADSRLEHLLQTCAVSREEWQKNQKLKDDPRVHLLGLWLRRSSLDELPQLFNILRGDMSVVGPRPIVADELRRYGKHVAYYLAERPGLTGLWQVSGRSDTSYGERVALDVRYVKSWTIFGDLAILGKTVFVVLLGRGSQ